MAGFRQRTALGKIRRRIFISLIRWIGAQNLVSGILLEARSGYLRITAYRKEMGRICGGVLVIFKEVV